jgi:hypothetical protein
MVGYSLRVDDNNNVAQLLTNGLGLFRWWKRLMQCTVPIVDCSVGPTDEGYGD